MTLSGLAIGGIISLSVVLIALLKRHFNGGKNVHYPDLEGKIVVITGANTGLGFISAREMAKLKASKIILACRSEQRGTDAVNKIKNELKVDNVEFMQFADIAIGLGLAFSCLRRMLDRLFFPDRGS